MSHNSIIIRILDLVLVCLGTLLLSPILLPTFIIIFLVVKSPIFCQERLGRDKKPFLLFKLRTMKPGTRSVATHLASESSITPFGRVLRRTKLDELPQVWNVLKGEMSLVGPRPGLANQIELTAAREAHGVFAVRPGITGLAQVNEIDMSTPELLAKTDAEMIRTASFKTYFKYIFLTVIGSGSGDRVR